MRREVAADDELLMALARVALDKLGEARPATIRLHPDDFTRAAARGARTVGGRARDRAWRMPRSAAAAASSNPPFGFVDAAIDAQFQELARALLDGDDRRPRSDESDV